MNRATLPQWFARCFILVVAVSVVRLTPAEQSTDPHKRLKDPAPAVRKQAALALALANEAEAIPVLIDLLLDLPAEQRRTVEEFLTNLAGEWAPLGPLPSEDRIARKIRRDAWMVWWRDTDGPALLAVVRDHTLTPELRRKIKELIGKLGDDRFSTREAATKELFDLGRITLPQLREAVKGIDLEAVQRARDLIGHIEREPSRSLPAAAPRLLALRKPEGAAAALLAYMPLAEEENRTEEVKSALALLARRDGKLDASLVRALAGDSPLLRAVAAEALVEGGGKEGRASVHELLKDNVPTVRLRVALALVAAGERASVAVLIDLLTVVSSEQLGQIEDLLQQLAGESAPVTAWGLEQAEKKKCRDAWAAWWKANGDRVDLAQLNARPSHGFTLLCDSTRNRVFEIDRDGKERWAIHGVPFPVDAWVIGSKRVLIAEYNGRQISERDFKGNILWFRQVSSLPVNVQRLANGNTFIATQTQILEVDRGGKELYAINNVPGGITAAYRARDGRILCLARNATRCVTMNTNGKILKEFASNRDGMWTSGIDLLSNGHILITQPNRNKVAEFDRDGNLIVEVDAPLATTATGLPNSHFLIASSNGQRAFEVDRGGKVVWEYKAGGSIFRARRR
ncbi:MAG: HEAT repeat domain-containing protein [Gemmataceae bacterium]